MKQKQAAWGCGRAWPGPPVIKKAGAISSICDMLCDLEQATSSVSPTEMTPAHRGTEEAGLPQGLRTLQTSL